MFAVIFEVQPRKERRDDYLAIARELRPALEGIDGFIDNERFASRRREGWLLSLSTWRDEKALIRWRTLGRHHQAQVRGRQDVFRDYHLRVGEVTADTAAGAGLTSQRLDETETGAAKAVTISEWTPGEGETMAALGLAERQAPGLVEHELFESIYDQGRLLLLAAWRDAAAAQSWRPQDTRATQLRHRQVRIIRDYGMFDRREAPQFYPPVERGG